MNLQVLLVEDEPRDLETFKRDLPAAFLASNVPATIHAAPSFEEAMTLITDPSRRFDLILSDTFRGAHARGDAAVLEMVERYRSGRFCPLVVFSASAQPALLELGAFVLWADKATPGGIENAIGQILATGIPQAARWLHDELDVLAGSYLWGFLEKRWDGIQAGGHATPESVNRLIRRRAALQLAEIALTSTGVEQIAEVHGLEFYMYPPINETHYALGEVIRHNEQIDDVRVILTPRCYLVVQPQQTEPRAKYVRVVKAVPVREVLGPEKLDNALKGDVPSRDKKLRSWTTPPSGDFGKPEGRYWYLPAFLEIPHLFCDFLQVDSLPFEDLEAKFHSLAVLAPPYAESLQSCWTAFDSAVGIPNLVPSSVASMLNTPAAPAVVKPK